jgi:thiazole biosynthesis/tRNA modification protein ThiI
MRELILCKYGEVALKGLNRGWFEEVLLRDIRARLAHIGKFNVKAAQCTIYIEPRDQEQDTEAAFDEVKTVFGLSAVSRGIIVEKDMDEMKRVAAEYLPQFMQGVKTFRAEARRSDKRFPVTSPKIAAEIGGAVLSVMPNLKVNLTEPEITVRAEVREKYAYLSAGQERAAGGMPYGTNGKGLVLLSGGIDSPVAAHMIARRGVTIEALHFESTPYTSERAREKVLQLAKLIANYCGKVKVHVISVTHIQEELQKSCEEEYFTLLLRRFMMRLAQRTAELYKCNALITGESIGQVASQTMQAIEVTNAAVTLPVFRPCIGMDKEDIVDISKKIGTYETSILPYEDCCTIFTPRHPRTRPEIDKVIEQENLIDIAALEDEAFVSMFTQEMKKF